MCTIIVYTAGYQERPVAGAIREYLNTLETVSEYADVWHITGATTVLVILPDTEDGEEFAEAIAGMPCVRSARARDCTTTHTI